MNPKIYKRSSVLLSNNYGSTVCKKALCLWLILNIDSSKSVTLWEIRLLYSYAVGSWVRVTLPMYRWSIPLLLLLLILYNTVLSIIIVVFANESKTFFCSIAAKDFFDTSSADLVPAYIFLCRCANQQNEAQSNLGWPCWWVCNWFR